MRLNELKELNHFHLFVKFVNSENVDDLLNGNLYMNPLRVFIEQERREMVRGQGDKYEGAHVFGVYNIKLYDEQTGMLIMTAPRGTVVESNEEIVGRVPVFCFTKFTAKDFEVIEFNQEHIVFKLNIDDKEKSEFMQRFGNTAVILPENFPQLIVQAVDGTDDYCVVADARYDDYSRGINEQHKKDIDEGSLELVLWKDKFFQYQREVRFAFSTKPTETGIKYSIGSIRNLCSPIDKNKFFDLAYEIKFK